jgi:hypothetical protein
MECVDVEKEGIKKYFFNLFFYPNVIHWMAICFERAYG